MSQERPGIPDPSEKLIQSEAQAREFAKLIQPLCPPNWGFFFSLFDFTGPEMTWISNAERDSAIKALEELIGRLKEKKSGDIVQADPDLKIRRLKAMLWQLTAEERVNLFGEWCRYCGEKCPPATSCTCMRDE